MYKFIIVGSGWRSLYYVRIARALPQLFELGALLCRTEEKAERIRREHGIPTTTSIEECLALKPDFAVVAVNKAAIADVSEEWLHRGLTVLCETPVVQTDAQAEKLRTLVESGVRLTVAEQYTRYPTNRAVLNLLATGIIGEADYALVSQAHEYHGASLIRAFLGIGTDVGYEVSGKAFEFSTTETLSRYEKFTDGRVSKKKRTVGLFEFENGKVALYEFDSEQYRSPIRGNLLKIQGRRGEVLGDTVRYLDEENEPHTEQIEVESRVVRRDSDNPNLCEIREIVKISFRGEVLYEPPFELCGLSEDETAIATIMRQTGEYARGSGENPYGFEEALRDAEMGRELGADLHEKV